MTFSKELWENIYLPERWQISKIIFPESLLVKKNEYIRSLYRIMGDSKILYIIKKQSKAQKTL